MFMRYVHTEDDPVREAAEAVTRRRLSLVGGALPLAPSTPEPVVTPAEHPSVAPAVEPVAAELGPDGKPLGFEDGNYTSRTRLGNYRPFRHRSGQNRAVPPGTKRADAQGASHV
jgi:hypothetical protein